LNSEGQKSREEETRSIFGKSLGPSDRDVVVRRLKLGGGRGKKLSTGGGLLKGDNFKREKAPVGKGKGCHIGNRERIYGTKSKKLWGKKQAGEAEKRRKEERFEGYWGVDAMKCQGVCDCAEGWNLTPSRGQKRKKVPKARE